MRSIRRGSPRTPPPDGAQRIAATGKPYPPRVDWEELGADFLDAWGRPNGKWMPEHLEILGPSGSGKSHFLAHILKARAELRGSHIVVLATKPADETISSMGWPVVTSWPPSQWKQENAQVIYWAKRKGLGPKGIAAQRAAVEDLLEQLWQPDANIIVVFDEVAYVEQVLGLRTIITTYYREGRTLGITCVSGTQRPQGVSRYVHSESRWCVCFAPKDEDDAERMAQVLGDKRYYREVLATLDPAAHEFLLRHTFTGQEYISHIPPPEEPKEKPPATEKEPGTSRPGRAS